MRLWLIILMNFELRIVYTLVDKTISVTYQVTNHEKAKAMP